MGKNRIKNLRTITVDDVEYKWMYDGSLKVWKDKKIVYEEGYNKGYSMVSYNLEDDGWGSMTPKIVAKVIRLVNGTEDLISNEDINSKLNEISYYHRHDSFEDKKTERLWAEFNDAHKELKEHLE